MKKTLLSLITITFFLCEASFTGGGMVFAENFGTNLTWTISETTLTISVRSGYTTGTMPYWNNTSSSPLYYTNRPWEKSKTIITTVNINKGVKTSVVMLFMVLQRLLPLILVQALQIHVVSILSARMRFIIVPKLLLYIVMEALPLMPCAIGLTSALMVLMQTRIANLRLRVLRRSFT